MGPVGEAVSGCEVSGSGAAEVVLVVLTVAAAAGVHGVARCLAAGVWPSAVASSARWHHVVVGGGGGHTCLHVSSMRCSASSSALFSPSYSIVWPIRPVPWCVACALSTTAANARLSGQRPGSARLANALFWGPGAAPPKNRCTVLGQVLKTAGSLARWFV